MKSALIRSGLTLFIALAFASMASAAAAAQAKAPGKKVYISADIEGISGISGDELTGGTGADYGRGRRLMTEDVNAAIRGAVEGGATEVVVADSHGGMRNIIIEELNPAARLVAHTFRPYGMMQGLDETFDAVIFVGYHAKASSPRGLFAHTGSGVLADVRINGRSVGEGGMNTMVASWFGVPVVLVTGDDVAVAQVKEVATEARGVVVKRAINLRSAELEPLQSAHAAIQAAARDAVASAKRVAPDRKGPYRWTVQFRQFFIPEVAEALPGIERTAPDTLAFTAETMPAGYRLFRVLYRYINPD